MKYDFTAAPPMLIGLTGAAGVGKTTIAQGFEHEQDYRILSFAKPLKEALIAMTGLDPEWFYDSEHKEKEIPGMQGTTPRIMMQLLGTEYAREMISPDFWLWRMQHQISNRCSNKIVIDDIRFDNEAHLVRSNGGIVIHLRRDFVSPTKQKGHESENPIKLVEGDCVITSPKDAKSMCTFNLVASRVRDFYR